MATGVRATRVTATTPIGAFTAVVTDRGVAATWFHEHDAEADAALVEAETRLDHAIPPAPRSLAGLRREIEGYFAGTRRSFDTPVDLRLGPAGFGRRVLEVTATIDLYDAQLQAESSQAQGRTGDDRRRSVNRQFDQRGLQAASS